MQLPGVPALSTLFVSASSALFLGAGEASTTFSVASAAAALAAALLSRLLCLLGPAPFLGPW